jgi:hypothetical protein
MLNKIDDSRKFQMQNDQVRLRPACKDPSFVLVATRDGRYGAGASPAGDGICI